MEYDLAGEELESFFLFQNVNAEDVEIDQFSKFCLQKIFKTASLIWFAS
jgi:hypothetical protein